MIDRDVTPRSAFTTARLASLLGRSRGVLTTLAAELHISDAQLCNHLAGRRYRADVEAWLHARFGLPYKLPPHAHATVRAAAKSGNPGPRRRAGASVQRGAGRTRG